MFFKDAKSKEIKEAEEKLNHKIFENSDILTEYTELQRKKYNNMHDVDKWNKLIGNNSLENILPNVFFLF